jgi:hypothetical protein
MGTVAEVICDMAHSQNASQAMTGMAHPNPTQWNTIVEWIREALVKEGKPKLPIVPWNAWMSTLERRGVDAETSTTDMVGSLALSRDRVSYYVIVSRL